MTQVPKLNPEYISSTQVAIDAELLDLEHQAKTILRNTARPGSVVVAEAEIKLVGLLTKAYALGGRAEWSRAQAARLEQVVTDQEAENDEGVAREVWGHHA